MSLWTRLFEPIPDTVGLSPQVLCLAACCTLGVLWFSQRSKVEPDKSGIPHAPGAIPILGHAIRYKKDPPGCLRSIQVKVGNIFRINLAGRRMVIVSGSSMLHQIHIAPESILSSYQAIAGVGFDVMLGQNAVYDTRLHKLVIKEFMQGDFETILVEHLKQSISIELSKYHSHSSNVVTIPDLFSFVRRCVIRVILDALVGRCILIKEDGDSALIDELILFQDAVEAATAKAAVLPRWASVPLVLKSIHRMRQRLQRKIEQRIDHNNDAGLYLHAMRDRPIHVQSEMIVGLIFAAHKNPSIGAAQTVCYTMEACRNESRINRDIIRLYVLETLRTTANTIGSLRAVKESSFTLTGDYGEKFILKKGEIIATSHLLANTDINGPWGPTAATFDITRYTDSTHGTTADSLTFSSGVHKCPGERVAVTLVTKVVEQLMSREIRPVDESLPEVCFARATLAQRAAPVRVRMNM